MADLSQPSAPGSSAVKDRIKNLEARARTTTLDSSDKSSAPPPRAHTTGDIVETSAAVARLRNQPRSRGASGSDHELQMRPRRTLANISEQRVMKTGIVWLKTFFVGKSNRPVEELDRRKDGSPLFMQAAFFKRLLSDNIELKVCMDSDVSAAQSDIRYLTLEQLLTIRAGTLDFSTSSDSHSAHAGFLYTVDAHLFNKLARACLRQGTLPSSCLPKRPESWHALGVQIALVLGAVELLASGWDSSPNHAASEVTLPAAWCLRLDEETWQGCKAGVFHSTEVWFTPLAGEKPDFSSFGPVAVVSNDSAGMGKDRSLHWEIAVLDPQTEDLMAELMRKENSEKSKGRLSMELSDSLQRRFSTRKEALGLDAEQRKKPPDADAMRNELSVLSTPSRPKVAERVASIQSEQENITPPRVLNLLSRSQSERQPLKTNLASDLLPKRQNIPKLPIGDAATASNNGCAHSNDGAGQPLKSNLASEILQESTSVSKLPIGDAATASNNGCAHSNDGARQPLKSNLAREIVQESKSVSKVPIGDAASASTNGRAHPNEGDADILAVAKALELMDRDSALRAEADYVNSECMPGLPMPCCSGDRRMQYPRIEGDQDSANCPAYLQGGIYCMSR